MRKLFVFLAAFMLVASLFGGTAFATPPSPSDPPSSSVYVGVPDSVDSITIGDVGAYYQTDDNTDELVYIRAILPKTKSIDNLENATVVIMTSDTDIVVSGDIDFEHEDDTIVWTANNINLFNIAYDVIIDDVDYVLAAGLSSTCAPPADVAVSNVTFTNNSETAVADVYGAVVQNPFLGNQYFRDNGIPWTDPGIVYYIKAAFSNVISDRTDVRGTMTIPNGATATGDVKPLGGGNYSWNLSGPSPGIDVSDGTVSVHYYAFVSDASMIYVRYSFRMDEALAYTGGMNAGMDLDEFHKRAQYIQDKANTYFGNGVSVSSGTTVMRVLKDFLDSEFSGDYSASSTYLGMIHDLATGVVAGGADGWMYTDDISNPDYTLWPAPGVGAADYVLTSDSTIAWFFTVDYSTHPFTRK
jgi:hypothetical protein